MRQLKTIKAVMSLTMMVSLTATSALAKGTDKQENLFKCVDQTSLEMDATCMSSKIENSDSFVKFQDNFNSQIDDLGGNVMSTIIFYPELMETRVIAHLDTPSESEMALLYPVPKKAN